MLTAKEALELSGAGYMTRTAEFYQHIREQAMKGHTEVFIEEGEFPAGIIADAKELGYKINKIPMRKVISVKW